MDLEKTLESHLTARKSKQVISREVNPEYSWEGLMLKLKLQYVGHLMRRTDSLEKTLMLEKIEGKRRKCWQRMRCLDSITNSMHMNLSKLRNSGGHRRLECCIQKGKVKKAFLNEKCKEIKESNRMGMIRDLFKKNGVIRGTFHARVAKCQTGLSD